MKTSAGAAAVQWLLLLMSSSLFKSTVGFSSGAGRCVVGEPAPLHAGSSSGTIGQGGYDVSIDGISTGTLQVVPQVVAGEQFEIALSGPDFRGFLVMLANINEEGLLGRRPESQQATGSGCAGTAAVTHTGNEEKQSLTFIGLIDEPTTTTIEVNVVVANSGGRNIYYYSAIPLEVVAPQLPIETDAPTTAPVEATAEPTAAPTETPAAAPTGTPAAAPTGTPTGTPTTAPTMTPTLSPTDTPTATPTLAPTGSTMEPTTTTEEPTTLEPTGVPTDPPVDFEETTEPTTLAPTAVETTMVPTTLPTVEVTLEPTPVTTTAAPTSGGTTIQDGDIVCDEGFIMDNYCLELGVLLDNQAVTTLLNPELHSLHCLLDVPVCVESNYTMLREPLDGEEEYTVAYEFDAVGSALLRELGQSVGLTGYCASCSGGEEGIEFGFRAVVKGIVVDASVDPPLVNITEVLASNGTVTNETLAFCNITIEGPSEPPVENVTDVPATMDPTMSPTMAQTLPPGDTASPTLVEMTSGAIVSLGATVALAAVVPILAVFV